MVLPVLDEKQGSILTAKEETKGASDGIFRQETLPLKTADNDAKPP